MVDSPTPREPTLTLSGSPLEGQQHSAKPVSLDSRYSSPQVLAPFYHGAPPSPAASFPSESSQTRRPPNSRRRLPMPPVYVSHSPSAPTSSTSSSGLSPTTQLSTSRRHSYRPLPKRPEPPSELLENRNRCANTGRRSSTTSLTSRFVTQGPIDMEEIRRENLSKLRHHLGDSIPSDLVAPRIDVDETSNGSRVGGEVYDDHPKVPITAERLLREEKRRKDEKDERVVGSYSCRWLREEKGRRWVEDNYDRIIQTLREL